MLGILPVIKSIKKCSIIKSAKIFKSVGKSNLYFIYNIKDKSFDDVFLFSSLNAKLFTSDIIIKLMKDKNFFPIKKE